MKLNFWQWIGIILLIVAVVLIARRKTADTVPAPTTAPTTAGA